MNGAEPSWIPGLFALAAGALLGVFGALSLRRRGVAADEMSTTVADLDEQATHYIAQLRDLEEQRGRLEDGAYAGERSRLERLAANMVRERDTRATGSKTPSKNETPTTAADTAAVAGRRPWFQPVLWAVATLVIAGAALYLVNRESSARLENGAATGGGPAGTMGPAASKAGGSGSAPGLSAEVSGLLRRVTANPADVAALLRLSHMMLGAHGSDGARDLNDRVLALDPNNAEALIHAAVIKGRDGDATVVAASIGAIEAVLAKDSANAEGWFFRGRFALDQGDSAKVTESWTHYLAVAPAGPEKEQVRMFLQQQAPAAQP